MQKTVSKQVILKALRTEPLKAGRWMRVTPEGGIEDSFNWDEKRDLSIGEFKECSVCAVGAILRNVLPDTTDLRTLEDIACDVTRGASSVGDTTVEDLLRQKNYMGALSVFFENLPDMNNKFTIGPAERAATIRFVEKNFPNRVKLGVPPSDDDYDSRMS